MGRKFETAAHGRATRALLKTLVAKVALGGRLAVVAGMTLAGGIMAPAAGIAVVGGFLVLASRAAIAADAPATTSKAGTALPTKAKSKSSKFTLVSPDIAQGQTLALDQVYSGFGCTGKNISPALFWSGAPAGTQSFVVMVHDPDAPTGSGFWHWVVYNIPADATSLPAEAGDAKKKVMPAGIVQGRTDFGTFGYGGPCPPPGKPHHYHFRIFALKVPKLDIPADATAAMVGYYANTNKLAEAELVGLYGR
jgi:Raf kinase inhibitor-like YbhB/YbcL family protein